MSRLKRAEGNRLCKLVVGLLVVAVHGAVLVAVVVHTPIRPDQQLPQHREAMQLIEVTAVRTTPPPAAPSRSEAGKNTPALPAFRPHRPRTTASQQMPQMATPSNPAAKTSPAMDASTAVDTITSTAAPLKLDPETMRKAVQQVKLPDKAIDLMPLNSASREQSGSAAALSKGIASAQHGDCLHGEYVGSGMGHLSVPFLAAAYLRGHCAR